MESHVIDSLRSIIAQQDSMLCYVNRHPVVDTLVARETVWVADLSRLTSKPALSAADWIGWLVTLIGIAAAYLVARAGWEATERTSRKALEIRRELEDSRRRSQLILRVRGALETAAVTVKSTLKKSAEHAINPETMRDIVVEWERYDRVSDDLPLLGDAAFENRIDVVLGYARMSAEKVIEDERRFRETIHLLGESTPSGLRIDPTIPARHTEQRKRLHGLLEKMGAEAQLLLQEFNARWPARVGHEAREVPEVDEVEHSPASENPRHSSE